MKDKGLSKKAGDMLQTFSNQQGFGPNEVCDAGVTYYLNDLSLQWRPTIFLFL